MTRTELERIEQLGRIADHHARVARRIQKLANATICDDTRDDIISLWQAADNRFWSARADWHAACSSFGTD